MTMIYSALTVRFEPFNKWRQTKTVNTPEDMVEKDAILLLHGGVDISPYYYQETPIKENQGNALPSERDKREWALMNKAIDLGIPMFGICRGAQFLCIRAGGKLWQDTTGHQTGEHTLITKDGIPLISNSCHHQMMRIESTKHELLAWTKGISRHYKNEEGALTVPAGQHMKEPEIVWFPEIKGFAVQGHPEWLSEFSPFVQWCRSEFFKRIES